MLAQVQLGTLADWLAAVGTIGAFVVTYRLLRHELQERARGQANSVAAWVQIEPTDESQASVPGDDGDRYRWVAYVRNASTAPVYGCVVTVIDPTGPGDPVELLFETVAPGATKDWQINDFGVDCNVVPGLVVEVAFTDARGAHWCRDSVGALAPRRERARPF